MITRTAIAHPYTSIRARYVQQPIDQQLYAHTCLEVRNVPLAVAVPFGIYHDNYGLVRVTLAATAVDYHNSGPFHAAAYTPVPATADIADAIAAADNAAEAAARTAAAATAAPLFLLAKSAVPPSSLSLPFPALAPIVTTRHSMFPTGDSAVRIRHLILASFFPPDHLMQ